MLVNNIKNQGFSILEVVVSVGIISIILLSIALLSTKSLQMTQMAQMRQKAIMYSRQGIEMIRNDRETTAWNVFLDVKLDEYLNSMSFRTPEPGFFRTVSFIINDENTSVEIKCEVTWQDSKGDHSVSQTTKLTRWI